jgi:flagellar motor switch protein FliG
MARDRAVSTDPLSGVEKAAILLLSLGPEAACDVLRRLDEEEVRRVSHALAGARSVSPEQLEKVGQEFRVCFAGPSDLTVNGQAFARAVVAKALADPTAAAAGSRGEILAELEHGGAGAAGLAAAVAGVPAESMARLLEGEHPQIAALIVASIGPEHAARILTHLPEASRVDVIERVAHLDSAVPASLIAEVGSILREQVQGLMRESGSVPGGPKVVAEIIKQADKELEEQVFAGLEQRDGPLAETIRGMLFTFEDLMQLDNRGMQALLKEVAREDLLLSLKTASPELSQKIFSNVSSRAAEILREDLDTAGPARLSDVEAAQGKVVATMRELEADGKIVLAGSGKGDALV